MTARSKALFESTACSRCSGSGHYSWCQAYGSRCFKCGGRGWVLTKRGAAAAAKYRELLSKPASELQPGDQIRVDGFVAGSFSQPTRWYAVTAVRPNEESGASYTRDGVTVQCVGTTIECDGYCIKGAAPEQLFRVANSAEQKAAKLAIAQEFQATLTKVGKPRKVHGATKEAA